jgi:hypothetical protein
MHRCFALIKKRSATKIKAEKNDRKLALEAVRRGACEKLGMPMADDSVRSIFRGSSLKLHQHHYGSGHRHRRRGMHRNAQRAMVGIGIYRVNVDYLHHGQKHQQNKTHHGRQRQSTRLCAAFPA